MQFKKKSDNSISQFLNAFFFITFAGQYIFKSNEIKNRNSSAVYFRSYAIKIYVRYFIRNWVLLRHNLRLYLLSLVQDLYKINGL